MRKIDFNSLHHKPPSQGIIYHSRLPPATGAAKCNAAETDSGGGPVDFKFSTGYDCRVIVEIKLSTNTKLLPGFTRQLEAYKTAEDAKGAFYVVIDVGSMGTKDEKLLTLKNAFDFGGKVPSEIKFIDGITRPSASQL